MSQSFAFMVEINDLTQSVIWDDIPDANVPQSAVTQHVAAIDHDSLLNFAADEHFADAPNDSNNYVRYQNTWVVAPTYAFGEYSGEFDANSPGTFPVTSNQGDWFNCTVAGTIDSEVFAVGDLLIALVDSPSTTVFAANWSKIANVEINDLSASVTWANIPDANVPESAVTQHEAALAVTRSQISDMPQATTTELEDNTDAINTDAAKVLGYAVLNTTTGVTVFAAGNGDSDVWDYYDATTAHTPV